MSAQNKERGGNFIESKQDVGTKNPDRKPSFREHVNNLLNKIKKQSREARGFSADIPKSELPDSVKNREEIMDLVAENTVAIIEDVEDAKRVEDVVGAAAYADRLERLANDPNYAAQQIREEKELELELEERQDPILRDIYEALDRTTNPETIDALHVQLEKERGRKSLPLKERIALRRAESDANLDNIVRVNQPLREEEFAQRRQDALDGAADNAIKQMHERMREEEIQEIQAAEFAQRRQDALDRAADNAIKEMRERTKEGGIGDAEIKERERFPQIYEGIDSDNPAVRAAALKALDFERRTAGLSPAEKQRIRDAEDEDEERRNNERRARTEKEIRDAELHEKWMNSPEGKAAMAEAAVRIGKDEYSTPVREALVDSELVASFLKEGLNMTLESGNVDLSNKETWDKILKELEGNERTKWKAHSLKDRYRTIQNKAKDTMRFGREGQIHEDVKKEFDDMCREFVSNVYDGIEMAGIDITQYQ